MTIQTLTPARLALVASLAFAPPALARTEIAPYLEFDQVVTADLKNGGDVLTYSTIAAGIDASVSGPRAQGQIGYRYERRIGWGDRLDDQDIHSGIARGRYEIVPSTLAIEGGALAARTRTDIRAGAPGILTGNVDNVSQVYSAYVGPTYTDKVGDLNVAAAYRLGYSAVDGQGFDPGPGQPRIDAFSDSVSHLATGSVGMGSGALPFGWTVSGGYARDDAGQLDQRFESMHVRGDIVVPVTPTLAAVGGVGYENVESSARAPLVDAGGAPVINSKGRFVTDPASPRLLAYDQDGIYWDVGVAWKPSRRTNLEARVGRRYGSMSYTGSFDWQVDQGTTFGAIVYDQVLTFGQQLGDNLSRLPTSFTFIQNPLSPGFGGCVIGANGGSAGGCINPALGAINTSAYRARGVNASLSRVRGRWTSGVGFGYNNRKYLTPQGIGFALAGVTDEDYYLNAQALYNLNDRSSIGTQAFAAYYDSGILGSSDVISTGASAAYNRTFGRRLSGTAALGLSSSKVEGEEADLFGSALLGLRYTF